MLQQFNQLDQVVSNLIGLALSNSIKIWACAPHSAWWSKLFLTKVMSQRFWSSGESIKKQGSSFKCFMVAVRVCLIWPSALCSVEWDTHEFSVWKSFDKFHSPWIDVCVCPCKMILDRVIDGNNRVVVSHSLYRVTSYVCLLTIRLWASALPSVWWWGWCCNIKMSK